MDDLRVIFPDEILKASTYLVRDDNETVLSGSYQSSLGPASFVQVFPYSSLVFPYPVKLKRLFYFITISNAVPTFRKPVQGFFELRINTPNNPLLSTVDAEFALGVNVLNNNNIIQCSLPNEQSVIETGLIPHTIPAGLDLLATFNVFDTFTPDNLRINWSLVFSKIV